MFVGCDLHSLHARSHQSAPVVCRVERVASTAQISRAVTRYLGVDWLMTRKSNRLFDGGQERRKEDAASFWRTFPVSSVSLHNRLGVGKRALRVGFYLLGAKEYHIGLDWSRIKWP